MSILNRSPEKVAADLVDRNLQSMFSSVKSDLNSVYNAIFHNLNAAPDVVLAEIGTDAATILNVLSTGQAFINSLVPNTVTIVLPAELVINQDGTAALSKNLGAPQQVPVGP